MTAFGTTMRGWIGALAAGAVLGLAPLSAHAAPPLKAVFDKPVATTTWKLADIDAALPADWTPYKFLVLEFRATSSQRFELGLVTDKGLISKRIHPYANVWVRASIPLDYFRNGLGDAIDLAATVNKPANSYWINIEAGGHGPTTGITAVTATMRYPVGDATLEIRSLRLSNEDPGDALLDGKPIIDAFGQYIPDDWAGKARSEADLKASWSAEDAALSTVAPSSAGLTRYGGFAAHRAKATGFFRVEKIDGRWWFVDPEGALFYSTGVNGIGGTQGTRTAGREAFFTEIPTTAAFQPPAGAAAPTNANPNRNRATTSFLTANLVRRYGASWQAPWTDTTLRRMRAWGLNTAYSGSLNQTSTNPERRVAYVLTLRDWQTGGSIMGMPDVYSDAFVQSVDAAAQRGLAARKDDPWMLGYFIGNEPPWPGRESQLVDLFLAGPPNATAAKFREELAKGDTPERRKQMVLDAFARYLEVINTAVKRHDPNHLNLGIRFGGTPPMDVVRLAKNFDVYSMNKYRWTPPKGMIDEVAAALDLPILIGEFHIGVPGRGLAPGLVQAMNQDERGQAYAYYVENAAAHPSVIGTHWFQWSDQMATGRNDGENYNIGWIDVTDRPYAPLVRSAKETHGRLFDIHTGKTKPTAVQAKASERGTPADAIQLGIPAIQ